MARGSRPARAAKHASSHGKRSSAVRGNNKFGSKGCLKCEDCRRRKTKCIYDKNNPNAPCDNCKKRTMSCSKGLPAVQQLENYARSVTTSTSPEPSDASTPSSGSPSSREYSVIEVEMSPSQIPVSQIIEEWRQTAEKLEKITPHRSSDDVWDQLRPRVMDFMRKKAEDSETDYSLRGDHHDASRVPRASNSHSSPMHLPSASYVNATTLEHDEYPSTYSQWSGEEGHPLPSQEEYWEESQESYPPYEGVSSFYSLFPPPDPVASVFMLAPPIGRMQSFGTSC